MERPDGPSWSSSGCSSHNKFSCFSPQWFFDQAPFVTYIPVAARFECLKPAAHLNRLPRFRCPLPWTLDDGRSHATYRTGYVRTADTMLLGWCYRDDASCRSRHSSKAGRVATTIAEDAEIALEAGLEFERQGDWADAIRHYEEKNRLYPQHKALYQRLVISRLHYDVNRRFQDISYTQSLHQMSVTQALDLYAEILANLNTHYVEDVDWARVQLHGTAALEVALTEEKFTSDALPGADTAKVEAFRQNVHRRLADRANQTRFDLRANVAYVASLASSEIGLSPTATVLEYVSGAVSTLRPLHSFVVGQPAGRNVL